MKNIFRLSLLIAGLVCLVAGLLKKQELDKIESSTRPALKPRGPSPKASIPAPKTMATLMSHTSAENKLEGPGPQDLRSQEWLLAKDISEKALRSPKDETRLVSLVHSKNFQYDILRLFGFEKVTDASERQRIESAVVLREGIEVLIDRNEDTGRVALLMDQILKQIPMSKDQSLGDRRSRAGDFMDVAELLIIAAPENFKTLMNDEQNPIKQKLLKATMNRLKGNLTVMEARISH